MFFCPLTGFDNVGLALIYAELEDLSIFKPLENSSISTLLKDKCISIQFFKKKI